MIFRIKPSDFGISTPAVADILAERARSIPLKSGVASVRL
jgi:hypothetical protein